MSKNLLYLLIIALFIFGIYFLYTRPTEPFVTGQCPTTLIKDGNEFLVYNSEYEAVPGVNPIKMGSLDDYKDYIKWQRENKLNCPILHLEKVFDTQGSPMYEIRPDFDQQLNIGGVNHNLPMSCSTPNIQKMLDNSLDRPPFNQNQYPAYDKENQNIGLP